MNPELRITNYESLFPQNLELAIYQTVRFFDLFGMPVTATQVWQNLIVEQEGSGLRWGGRGHYSLPTIQAALRGSPWLQRSLVAQWGFYTMPGKQSLVRQRLLRHARAQDKWKITRRVARLLAAAPFVRGLAGSGSLALDNTGMSSDLDLLVFVEADRIWTARLFLLIASQLTGRRRKYWDQQAPDKVCLNHYIASDRLGVSHDIQNVYTAVSYSRLVPIWGRAMVQQFQRANGSWMRQYVMSPEVPDVPHTYEVALWPSMKFVKQLAEAVLLEPVGGLVEYLAEKIQRWVIQRHQQLSRSGRVILSAHELAFHPDTRVPAILSAFHQDPGQRKLL